MSKPLYKALDNASEGIYMLEKRLCFVIMGYGVKTDYSTGRQLDLDKTYKNIIKPAAEEAGLHCIRADEIRHSGIIDVPMYQYLINAEVVIADLSTYNTNAFYELGVRHALRPHTTIAIAEKDLKKPFDVNHTVIHQYEHLGKDIGYDEVIRFRKELQAVIETILKKPMTDSPVYTNLSGLKPPMWDNGHSATIAIGNNSLSVIVESANKAMDNNDFMSAINLFELALKIDSNDTYVTQRLAVATYKSEYPSLGQSLEKGATILSLLEPDISTDPETLGIAGAINKRLWEITAKIDYLNKAIYYYEKGFYIKNDYYNGINLAYLIDLRGSNSLGEDRLADKVIARRIRKKVIYLCEKLLTVFFEERGDKYWIFATLEEAYFGIDDQESYLKYRKKACELAKENWERDTTELQIEKLSNLLSCTTVK